MHPTGFHTIAAHHAAQLGAITGSEHVSLDDDSIAIAPANTEEVAAILRFANQNGVAICPYGGGTKQNWGQSWGNQAQPALILNLNLRRLNSLREHTWQDMTATVEAGCRWSSMQSMLARHGQFVALDPLWPERSTVGGIASTNDSGALRLKYGSLRDLIIGMTVVLADGTIAHSGGKVVKNVAGYDLHKLMIRAFGTLGVITEVTFRLHAIPRHTRSFTITSPSAGPLGSLLLELLASFPGIQSIQLRTGADHFALDIRLAALPEALDTQAASLAALAQNAQLRVDTSSPDAWNAIEEEAGRMDAVTLKATMLPSAISHFADAVHALGGRSVTQATGIMAASFPMRKAQGLRDLRRELEAAGGSLTILWQPAETNLDPWGALPDTLPLMREIKRRFDPNRILNPGHFLGEI